jgi:hypothetical protein
MRKPKKQKKPLNDLNRSLTPFDPNETLIGVVELSKGSWLVAGIIPGVERQPLKKLAPDEDGLLKLLERCVRKRRRQGTRSPASPLPSRPAGTASGWPAG